MLGISSSRWREQRILERTGIDLACADPRLAAMLAMFTRLTAKDGSPPDEDLITARLRPGHPPPGQTPAAAALQVMRGLAVRPRWRAIVTAVVIALLALTMALGLASTFRCSTQLIRPGPYGHPSARSFRLSCPAGRKGS